MAPAADAVSGTGHGCGCGGSRSHGRGGGGGRGVEELGIFAARDDHVDARDALWAATCDACYGHGVPELACRRGPACCGEACRGLQWCRPGCPMRRRLEHSGGAVLGHMGAFASRLHVHMNPGPCRAPAAQRSTLGASVSPNMGHRTYMAASHGRHQCPGPLRRHHSDRASGVEGAQLPAARAASGPAAASSSSSAAEGGITSSIMRFK